MPIPKTYDSFSFIVTTRLQQKFTCAVVYEFRKASALESNVALLLCSLFD